MILKCTGHRNTDKLLTNAGMHGPEELALGEQLQEPLLGTPDELCSPDGICIGVEATIRNHGLDRDVDVIGPFGHGPWSSTDGPDRPDLNISSHRESIKVRTTCHTWPCIHHGSSDRCVPYRLAA